MGEGHRAAVEGVDLLGTDPRDRGRLVLGIARGDRHLGALGALAGADELGDMLGQGLGTKRGLAQDDLADGLVDDLLEAGHVRALLVAAEIHRAIQPRVEQLVADADDLLDARHPDPGEAERNARSAGLHVIAGAGHGGYG